MFSQPDGVMNYYHTPYLIDLIRYGAEKIPEFEVTIDEQFRELEVRENRYVPESGVATMSLFGEDMLFVSSKFKKSSTKYVTCIRQFCLVMCMRIFQIQLFIPCSAERKCGECSKLKFFYQSF